MSETWAKKSRRREQSEQIMSEKRVEELLCRNIGDGVLDVVVGYMGKLQMSEMWEHSNCRRNGKNSFLSENWA